MSEHTDPRELDTHEDPVGSVRTMPAARVDLDLDAEAERIADLEPYTFKLGGQNWTVQPPGVDEALDAEQAPYVSDFLRIVMGHDLWTEFQPVFRDQEKPALAWKLGRALAKAFKLDAASVQEESERDDAGNRAGRRAAARRQPRRR